MQLLSFFYWINASLLNKKVLIIFLKTQNWPVQTPNFWTDRLTLKTWVIAAEKSSLISRQFVHILRGG